MPPEAFELSRPFVQRPNLFGVGSIKHSATVAANVDETNVQQDTQVFRHRWLPQAHGCHDLSDSVFLESEIVQDLAPARFCDGVESIRCRSGSRHGQDI